MYNPGSRSRAATTMLLWLILSVMSVSLGAQQARVEAQLSAETISVDDTVQLSVRAFSINGDIDISALQSDFDVIGESNSHQVNIVNGQRASVIEWLFELVPKREGQLIIPAISVGSTKSNQLQLTVEKSPAGAERDVFVEAKVDNTSPYVQSQVIYTLRVYYDAQVIDGSLQDPEFEGATFTRLAGDKTSQETIDGRNYKVLERQYAFFPRSSGDMSIPPVTLQTTIAINPQRTPNVRSRRQRLIRRSDEIVLSVQPRPDGLSGNWWLPAQQVQVSGEWSAPVENIEVGQPLTRTIRLLAVGLSDAELPELAVPEVKGLSIYADAPQAVAEARSEGVIAEQRTSWAIIPQQVGPIELPELRIDWFNTRTGKAEVAILPAETLQVLPSSSAVSDKVQAQPNALVQQPSPTDAESVEVGGKINDETAAALSTDIKALNGKLDQALVQVAGMKKALRLWRSIAIAALLAWVLTAVAFWLSKRRSAQVLQSTDHQKNKHHNLSAWKAYASSSSVLEPVQSACTRGDAQGIATALQVWGEKVWPENPPTHMNRIATRLQSAQLREALSEIDAALYRAVEPNGAANKERVNEFATLPSLLQKAVAEYGSEDQTEEGNLVVLPNL